MIPAMQSFGFDFTPLRRRRREMEISQRRLAAEAGMHWHTLLRTERNQTVPDLHQVIALARALGVPADSLFNVVDR
jgi:transcriptional regulator with XRE-family HTH domain